MQNALYIGVDYYPEHWDEGRWPRDAELMAEFGVDFVRMGEFSWQRMEPAAGQFDFDWLDRAIALLAEKGIRTILGTPSAAAPNWIIQETPEILPVDSEGRRTAFGGRHHNCQSNRRYRAHIDRFVRAMATHFALNPNVVGWQIDNELGNSHQDLCHCESCREHFQAWLERKYGQIEALNRAWGTSFWSQGYDAFDCIDTPKHTVAGKNPSQVLDWKRFCSDLIVDFQQQQVDILRELCPQHFITHNFMGFAEKVNYYDLAGPLDFISHDQYPGGFFRQEPYEDADVLAAHLDLMRSVKDKPFWIMEQQSGATGWQTLGRSPLPGQLELWSAQAIARGADAVCFFRWRTCSFGTEEYWHGILPHHGEPGRSYSELQRFATQIKPVLDVLHDSRQESEVAIVYSYDQAYALGTQPQNESLRYVDALLDFYRPLFERHVDVDFVSDQLEDYSAYKVVIAPLVYLTCERFVEAIERFVEDGGTLLLTYRAGVMDWNNVVRIDGPLPGAFRELAGIHVPEYDNLRSDLAEICWDDETLSGRLWGDVIELDTARALAQFSNQYYAGQPAITENDYGSGRVLYCGTQPQRELADRLVRELLDRAGVGYADEASPTLEITERVKDGRRYRFLLNHDRSAQDISAWASGTHLGGSSETMLPPFAWAVYAL